MMLAPQLRLLYGDSRAPQGASISVFPLTLRVRRMYSDAEKAFCCVPASNAKSKFAHSSVISESLSPPADCGLYPKMRR
eukprot:2434613-Pyramimonas_sp.AAC.1